MNLAWKTAKRLVIGVIGGTVLLVGVAMIVLPGPAFVVIPLGLAILATEFVWAKRLLTRVKDRVRGFPTVLQEPSGQQPPPPGPSASADHRLEVDPVAGGHAAGMDARVQDRVHQPPSGRADET